MQLGIQAVALDGERALLRDKAFERDRLHALIQLLETPCGKTRKQEHHALAHAQTDIRTRHIRKIAVKKHAAVFYADIFQLHTAQLVADQSL